MSYQQLQLGQIGYHRRLPFPTVVDIASYPLYAMFGVPMNSLHKIIREGRLQRSLPEQYMAKLLSLTGC